LACIRSTEVDLTPAYLEEQQNQFNTGLKWDRRASFNAGMANRSKDRFWIGTGQEDEPLVPNQPKSVGPVFLFPKQT
jgi:hypothetical protein